MSDNKQIHDTVEENERVQDDVNEVVYFGTRVKEEDKLLFVELGKKLHLTQHELFGKIVTTFLKMESIEGITQNNKGHAVELSGHLDRVLAIFMELITSTENIGENIKEQHKEDIKEKQGRIKELEGRIDRLKTEKKANEETINKSFDKEVAYYKEIEGLKKEIVQNSHIIEDKNTIINDKEATIDSLSKETEEYKIFEVKYQKQSEDMLIMSTTLKELESEVSALNSNISIKALENNNLTEKLNDLNERITELISEKKEKSLEITRLKEESSYEISELRKEVKELNSKLIEKIELNQENEKKYRKQISELMEKNKALGGDIIVGIL